MKQSIATILAIISAFIAVEQQADAKPSNHPRTSQAQHLTPQEVRAWDHFLSGIFALTVYAGHQFGCGGGSCNIVAGGKYPGTPEEPSFGRQQSFYSQHHCPDIDPICRRR